MKTNNAFTFHFTRKKMKLNRKQITKEEVEVENKKVRIWEQGSRNTCKRRGKRQSRETKHRRTRGRAGREQRAGEKEGLKSNRLTGAVFPLL